MAIPLSQVLFGVRSSRLAAQVATAFHTRCTAWAALPETAEASSGLERVQLSKDAGAPVLVRLAERPWAAATCLNGEQVGSTEGVVPGQRLAVVREAFAPFDQPRTPLSQLLRPMGDHHVAVASELARKPQRLLVDEYVARKDGTFALQRPAEDLLRYLNQENIQVALVPDVSTAEEHNSHRAVTSGLRQSTNEVLMVAPTAFGFNEQAAQDNSFMRAAEAAGSGSALAQEVLKEYAGLYHMLADVYGVKVNLFQHSLEHGTPDAVFPNNWFSTHYKGEAAGGVKQSSLALYPMKCPNRARERRVELRKFLELKGYERIKDWTVFEATEKKYLEGTGALVLDRVNGVAYVDLSERADLDLAERWVAEMGYDELVTFRATDLRGKPVYHTNVMMAIGTGVAVVCGESLGDPKERRRLLGRLRRTHEVVEISLAQMDSLCGNVIEVLDDRGLPVMAMSSRAHAAFTEEQRRTMLRHVAALVHAPIDTLEEVGGGGVRCCIAEIF